jgi:hypothetical protein
VPVWSEFTSGTITPTRNAPRLKCGARTSWRWSRAGLRDKTSGFPHPMRINKRRFWRLTDLEAWEAARDAERPTA